MAIMYGLFITFLLIKMLNIAQLLSKLKLNFAFVLIIKYIEKKK